MNPAQLLQHFDRISDAPDAILRLRRFILDLAVRGKLVEQDSRDEPAPELLKRIQAEKERLVKAGEIRKGNPFPIVEADETPFASPAGWEWVRIRQVTSDRGQATPDNNFTYIDVTAINKEVGCIVDAKALSASDAPSRARKLVRTGDVLYSCVRPYLLNVAVIENDIVPPPIASTAFAVLNGFGLVLSRYLWIVLRSPFMVESVEGKMRGQAYPAINDSDFALLPLPLPPFVEQQRIIAKVDEMMALCDRLEAAQAERESRRGCLVASSLHRMNNGADADAFRNHARFTLDNLPRLTTRTEHIQSLRQAILNLAVRGQLVPQDPSEEPARLLLVQLTANAKAYVLEQEIAPPTLAPIANENITFPPPPGWEWVRLSSLFKVITDGDHQPPPKATDGIAFLTIGNITTGKLDFSNCRFVGEEYWKSLAPYKKPAFGDILYTVVGATYGRPAYVDTRRHFCVQRHIAILKPTDQMNVRFLCSLLGSPMVYEQATQSTTGTAQPTIPLRPLRNFLVLLPPLAEQERIVAKVDELMALCDRLEAQLTTIQTENRRLLDAILHLALRQVPSTDVLRTTHSSQKMVGADTSTASLGRPNKHFARALLSAEIVHQLHAEPTFGRTKHQKILHLCEHIARIDEIVGEYHREAAGPLDNRMIYSVAAELKKQRWYEEYRRPQYGYGYRPLEKSGGHLKYLEKYWPDKLPVIRRLVDIMRTWDTDRCEMFATVYAAWNDLLILKREPSDEAILEEVLERWHERKKRFSETQWQAAIAWIRTEGFIPVGFGKPTKQLANF